MGLESKDILSKLKGEGLDWAHNHMSTLTYGQAETVKQWYREGQIASTAKGAGEEGESAPATVADESATTGRSKAPRKGAKKKAGGGDEHGEGDTMTAVA